MGSKPMQNVLLDFETVATAAEKALTNHGYAAAVARVLAENSTAAQRDGSTSHGLFRVRDYVATIKSGYVNGNPKPTIVDVAPGFLRADADNGFSLIAQLPAREALVEKARRNGIAILAIRNSHSLSALYLDVEPFAEQGLLALSVVNSMGVVAPHGGHKGVYGTNPVAFAAPRAKAAPVILDLAASSMAHGDLQVAAREGRSVPDGTGIDAAGQPTNIPSEILNGGALLPFGGHKGGAIALMVEILCAGLVGADFSHEVTWAKNPGARTAHTGQTLIVIDPRAGAGGLPDIAQRVDVLASAVMAAGQKHLPGDRRLQFRARNGGKVEVNEDIWAAVLGYGQPG
jgi:delta1-piperideine-2-carboxylate reductase